MLKYSSFCPNYYYLRTKQFDVKELIITKASGDTAIFEMDKLRQSMRNAGATEEQIEYVVKDIEPRLYQGMTTKTIYKWAFSILKKQSKPIAARYQLKKAIMDIGPSGFPFEIFVSELLKKSGYSTKVGTVIQGSCVSHEIDVIASTEKEHLMVECKFHSQAGKMSDVKVPLYIQSRFIDVSSKWILQASLKNKHLQGLVVTNTRFSPDAVQYAHCIGLRILSWDYPLHEGLKDLIDQYFLYPITCLTSITTLEKNSLLKSKTLLCAELLRDQEPLKSISISEKRIASILTEINHMNIAKPTIFN